MIKFIRVACQFLELKHIRVTSQTSWYPEWAGKWVVGMSFLLEVQGLSGQLGGVWLAVWANFHRTVGKRVSRLAEQALNWQLRDRQRDWVSKFRIVEPEVIKEGLIIITLTIKPLNIRRLTRSLNGDKTLSQRQIKPLHYDIMVSCWFKTLILVHIKEIYNMVFLGLSGGLKDLYFYCTCRKCHILLCGRQDVGSKRRTRRQKD